MWMPEMGIVRLLLQTGARVNGEGLYRSAVQSAASTGHMGIVQCCWKRSNVNVQGGLDGSALEEAVSHGHDTTVRRLLKSGGKYSTVRRTCKCAAGCGVQQASFVLLLENGAEVNANRGKRNHSVL
jgi:Ankyrin repeats (3 copies)